MRWLCFCPPETSGQVLQPHQEQPSASRGPPQAVTDTQCGQDGKHSVASVDKPDSRSPQPSKLEQNVNAAFSRLTLIPGGQPLYRRINLLLEACRSALGACDARLATFSRDGSSWVYLPAAPADEPEAAPRAAGWGQTALYGLLQDQPDSIVVIRGYHSTPAGVGLAVTRPAGSISTLLSEAPIQQDPHYSQTPACGLGARTHAPDPYSFVSRAVDIPAHLQPGDLIAFPVHHEGRLAASLLLGWDMQQPILAPCEDRTVAGTSASTLNPGTGQPHTGGASTSAGPAERNPSRTGAAAVFGGEGGSAGMELSPMELSHLQRLAQFMVFGLYCDPQQAQTLEEVAQRLSSLPHSAGLHDFVAGLLEAVPELLQIRFTLRLAPILLLTHGLTANGPAVLFTSRNGAQQAQPASNLATELFPVSAGGGGGSGGNVGMQRVASTTSIRVDGQTDTGDGGPSRIRAVRISLHHTLLAEALRSATKVQGQLPLIAVTSPSDQVPGAESATGGGLALTYQVAPAGPQPPLPQPIFSMIVPNISTHMLEEGAPCRDLLLCSNLAGCTMGSLALCVEAAAPSSATGNGGVATCGTASPMRAVEAASVSLSGGGCAHNGSAGVANSTGRVGGAAAAYNRALYSTSTNTAGSLPAAAALSAPLSVLHSQRQFGMYVVCSDPLPAAVLQAVSSEVQMLLGMALGACRDGALSMLGGGRCAVELYLLQEQLLGNNPAAASGNAAIVSHIAGAMAAALSSPTTPAPLASTSLQISLGAAAARTTMTHAAGRPVGRSFGPHGRPMPRSLFHIAASALLPNGVGGNSGGMVGAYSAAGGIRSAGSPRLAMSQMDVLGAGRHNLLLSSQQHNLNYRESGTAGGMVGSNGMLILGNGSIQAGGAPGDDGMASVESLARGISGIVSHMDDGMRWMLASSPEVLLEPPVAGPSPLEVMVSSMRSGLTAALTNAMMLDSSDEAKASLNQELAAVRLYDVIGRGGQGVVFHGTLHGLETAVKVIVHRGKGEPLAHDGGDPAVASEAGEEGAGAPAGAAAGAAAGGPEGDGRNSAGDLSRIRKAKRGAMELVVTGALSHPSIVQVLGSFSDVIMVRCTYRNELTPRLRLVAKDDPILAGWASPGPLNTVACLEYCDAGTLLEAAHGDAFRPAGSSALSGAVRPALVPLYTSLLEVALALRYLHSRRLVHCDIKPANVLLKSSNRDPRGWTCKLSDFGCVRLMTELSPTPEDLQAQQQQAAAQQRAMGCAGAALAAQGRSSARLGNKPGQDSGSNPKKGIIGFRVAQPLGTIAYMSPESFVRGHTLGAPVDIYAFGILMYELLMCRAPYTGMDAQTLPRLVLRQSLRPEFHPLSPPEYCNLAARCWAAGPSRRPTAAQLVGEVEALLADAQLKESRKLAQPDSSGARAPQVPAVGVQPQAQQPPRPELCPPPAPPQPLAAVHPGPPLPAAASPAAAAPGARQGLSSAAGAGPQAGMAAAAAAVASPLASIVPAAAEISQAAAAAAAAAGLDATIEVMQVQVPPGTARRDDD